MADLFTAEEAPQPWPLPRTSALRPKCLCIDLETSLDASPAIHKLAAWRRAGADLRDRDGCGLGVA